MQQETEAEQSTEWFNPRISDTSAIRQAQGREGVNVTDSGDQ